MKLIANALLLILILSVFSSCTEKKPHSLVKNSTKKGVTRVIDSSEIHLAEMLEGRWYNATFFITLEKTKSYSEACSKVEFLEFLTFDKEDILSDTSKISWDGYDCGGDYYYPKYNKDNNSLEVILKYDEGETIFSIKNQGRDSLYCIVSEKEKYLFLRDNFENHEEFKYEFNKAMIIGNYFVKSDSNREVNFAYPNIVSGIEEKYKYYSLNIFSADYHKTVTFFKEGDDFTKGEFFKYEIYKDSIVLNRVDEYLNSLDSTLVLISTNPTP